MIPSVGLFNFLERLKKPRENTSLAVKTLACCERTELRNSQMSEMLRARYGEGVRSLRDLSRSTLSPNLPVFTNPDALRTPSFWVFMAGSFHRHD